jgi:hypothetical protein
MEGEGWREAGWEGGREGGREGEGGTEGGREGERDGGNSPQGLLRCCHPLLDLNIVLVFKFPLADCLVRSLGAGFAPKQVQHQGEDTRQVQHQGEDTKQVQNQGEDAKQIQHQEVDTFGSRRAMSLPSSSCRTSSCVRNTHYVIVLFRCRRAMSLCDVVVQWRRA